MPLPRAVARFNRKATNKVTARLAPHLPGFGIVTHTGRRSGTTYHTPVNVLHSGNTLRFALTYGEGDWVRNVLAGGPASLQTKSGTYRIVAPTLVDDPEHVGWPGPARVVLRLTHTTQELRATDGSETPR